MALISTVAFADVMETSIGMEECDITNGTEGNFGTAGAPGSPQLPSFYSVLDVVIEVESVLASAVRARRCDTGANTSLKFCQMPLL